MASVFCLCGKPMWSNGDNNPRQMSGWCEECDRTKDCRKSSYWSNPPPPKAAKTTFKTKDTEDWKSYKKR